MGVKRPCAMGGGLPVDNKTINMKAGLRTQRLLNGDVPKYYDSIDFA